MKKLILLTIYTFNGLLAFSQVQTGTIKGMVIDSVTKLPLAYISVSLVDSATNKPVKSMQSRDNGSFELGDIPFNSYQFKISEVGYKTKIISVKLTPEKPVIVSGNISLSPSSTQLKEVAITAAKEVVKQEVDRLTYNVQADPDNKAMDMLDMIRKVPLLSVDGNNNIQLKGSGSYKILINGKESALMAHNPSDILQSMPASTIESIEVIITPPAKYDAEGLAGIINIITKKQHLQGYNGSVSGRYNNVYGPSVNLNTTVQEGKLGLAINAGYADNGQYATNFGITQTFLNGQGGIVQNGTHFQGGKNNSGVMELSYEIDSLNLLTGNIDFFNNSADAGSNQFSTLFAGTGALLQQYHLNTTGNSSSAGFDAGLNYQLGFKKSKARLLTLSYIFNYAPNQSFLTNVFSDGVNFSQPSYQQRDNAGTRTHTFQLDYAVPVTKLLLIEAGAKAILRDNYSDFNSGQTNNFNYDQDVYSLYNSYQAKAGNWAAKAGVRFEYTTIHTIFSTSYHNLIPSVALQRKFQNSSINFGFTERIQRPGIIQLNPFVNISNPEFISTGNPGLKPELIHTFELNYSHIEKNTITTGISYAFSNNAIQNVSYPSILTINNKPDTTTISTYQNLGSNRALSYNFNGSLSLTKQLNLNVNAQVSRIWLQGTYNGQLYSNGGYVATAFGGTSFLFDNGYRLSCNFSYASGRIYLEGRNGYAINSQFLLSKAFFKQKLSLSLVISSPYLQYQNVYSYTGTPDFTQTSYSQRLYRTFAFRFNYKFGKLKTEIKKNKVGINNDDVKPVEN